MTAQNLSYAIQLIKSGNKKEALPVLKKIVQAEPDNEKAWLWLYSCVESVEQKKYCLQKAIKINPNNQKAHNALSKFDVQPSTSKQAKPSTGYLPSSKRNNRKIQVSQKNKLNTKAILFGIFGAIAILFFIFTQKNSAAEFETVVGHPRGSLDGKPSSYSDINDVIFEIVYPNKMARGKTAKLLVTCTNNTNQPISELNIFLQGKGSAIGGGSTYDYFDGLYVSSTDINFIDSGIKSLNPNGQLAFFYGTGINAGETKTMTIEIESFAAGQYEGGLSVSSPPGNGFFIFYETYITTYVTND